MKVWNSLVNLCRRGQESMVKMLKTTYEIVLPKNFVLQSVLPETGVAHLFQSTVRLNLAISGGRI